MDHNFMMLLSVYQVSVYRLKKKFKSKFIKNYYRLILFYNATKFRPNEHNWCFNEINISIFFLNSTAKILFEEFSLQGRY